MAKFSKKTKLPKDYSQEIIMDLCEAIAATKNGSEAAELLTDLLGKQELEMIAKRLRVADMLLDEYIYTDIIKILKVGKSTIARVQNWLQTSGEGYRQIIERTRRKRSQRRENEKEVKLRGMKKKYPMYYWPQIVLEYWVHNATKKQKSEMSSILSKLDEKSEMYKELDKLLRN